MAGFSPSVWTRISYVLVAADCAATSGVSRVI